MRDIDSNLDFLLIGCDGIWETMSIENIHQFVKQKNAEQLDEIKVIEQLLDNLIAKESQEGVGCDNMSCILVKFK